MSWRTRELADAWASDRFLVSVPDIFWRQIPGPTADMTVAFERYGKFDPAQGMIDIADLVHDLKARPRCNGKVAMLGFYLGGRYALLGAASMPPPPTTGPEWDSTSTRCPRSPAR